MNQNTFRAEIVQLLPRLRRFGFALTGKLNDADDLTQAAVEKALLKSQQWEVGTRLDSWMYRIMQNLWIDQRRAKAARGEVRDLDEAGNMASDDGESQAHSRLMLQRTRDCLEMLPEDQRVVIAMVAIDGMSYRETSEALCVPVGTIMSRLSRARTALLSLMDTPSVPGQQKSGLRS